jgi:Ca-activated chloride channel family protein
MSFQSPLVLLALLAIPVVVVGYVLLERRRSSEATRFASAPLLPHVVDRQPGARRHLPLAILLAGLAAMIVGVARPHATVSVARQEATVILALDISRSMTATDVKPSRLDAARAAATAFLQRVPSKFQVGLVTFASRAIVAVPPTDDRSLPRITLATIKPGEGTAIGDAIAIAVRLAQKQRASDGTVPPAAVLVISDGARDGGRTSPVAAAKLAARRHVKVSAVLVGTQAGVVHVTLQGGFQETIKVPPSAGTLHAMTRETGGEFFTARTDERLKKVYEQLGSRLGHKRQSREVTDLFAGGAGVLLLIGGGLSTAWFRRIP